MSYSRLIDTVLFLALAATVTFGAACGASEPAPTVQHTPGSDMFDVPDDDAAMNAAIAQAQATLDDFARALHDRKAKQRDFSLKVKLDDGTNIEHVWLADPFVTDTKVGGVISNEIERVAGYTLGQPVAFGRDRVSDWMYVDHGVLQGGYTIRVLRDEMSPEERAEFDESMPFTIQ